MTTSQLLGGDSGQDLQTLGGGQAMSNAGSLDRTSFLLTPHIPMASLFARATGGLALSQVTLSYGSLDASNEAVDDGTGRELRERGVAR